jgi:hypothetical protein
MNELKNHLQKQKTFSYHLNYETIELILNDFEQISKHKEYLLMLNIIEEILN